MGKDSFADRLLELLNYLRCGPDRVVLMVDFAKEGGLKAHEVEPFVAEVLEERLYNLPSLFRWLKVVATFTSFPTVLQMKPGETKLFPRTDWMTYRRLIEREPDLLRTIAFGDYAIDSAPFEKLIGPVIPSAHLRYTTPDSYLIVKGHQAKKPVGYAEIYPVADTLAGRDEFMGASFSDGDGFVSRLALRGSETTPGNAWKWRWAGTDHHFACVLGDLRVVAGREPESERAPSDVGFQASLL